MPIIRKRYTKTEKLEIIKESLEANIELKALSARYGIHAHTISRWRREFSKHETSAFPGNGKAILTEEQREIERLRKRLEESELANEILKKAMGIISSPNRKNLLS